MAEALVSDLLHQLASMKVAKGNIFYEYFVRLEPNLQFIMPMLSDAEEREANEEPVKRWLEKVKDASYKIDNILDRCNTELIKADIESEGKDLGFFKILHNSTLMRWIADPVKNLSQELDVICDQAPHKIIAHQIKPPSKKLDVIVGEVSQIPPVLDVSRVLGPEYMKTLMRLLLDEDIHKDRNPCVIPLVGMGGIGKTFLARLAYNNDMVKASFDIRIWVYASKHFDQIRVAKEIIRSIEGQCPNVVELQSLLQRIFHLIRRKRFLLVLDDVWIENVIEWEPFRITLKLGAQGSRIIVTTRSTHVADKMTMERANVIHLNSLSDEECWPLFSETAFLDEDLKDRHILEYLGRQIVKRCRGSPLAAKILGSVMNGKKSLEEWNYVLNSLRGKVRNEGILFAVLLSSYYNLPSAVRRCFRYFAIFPKDEVIVVKDLIQLWMAQNYLSTYEDMDPKLTYKRNTYEDMEKVGHEYIKTLYMRSLVEGLEMDKDGKRIIRCKLHDLVHEFAQSLMKNEGFAIVVDGKLSQFASLHVNTLHLSLKFSRQTQFPMSVYNAKFLRTLLISNTRHVCINTVLPKLFQHLTCLRALNLSSSSIVNLPRQIENLSHLRFLNLSSNDNIKELPEEMCNLYNLQSLDVSRCYILEKLPRKMGKLINLRHLNLDGTHFMKFFPKGIGRLNSLRTLTKFIVGGNEWEGCEIEEFKDLNYLEGALEIKGLGNVKSVQEARNALLEKKIYLRQLCLFFDRGEKNGKPKNGVQVLNALKPHPNLEHLEIFGSIVLPNWMMSLTKLEKLKLSGFGQSQTLPPLGKLPSLQSLEISDTDCVKLVGVDFLGMESHNKKNEGLRSSVFLFQKLISLTFCDMKELEEWDGIGGMREGDGVSIMPCLQILTIHDCPKLKALPNFLETTPLRELSIEYCPQISNCYMLLTRLTELEVLVLKQCINWEHLPSLGKLPFLKSVSLWNINSVRKVGLEFLGIESNYKKEEGLKSPLTLFPMLRSLKFWSFGEWEEWDWTGGMLEEEDSVIVMPLLHSLIIYNCPKLMSLPSFLRTSPLKDLRISGCPILKQMFQVPAGDDWHKISHVPDFEIN